MTEKEKKESAETTDSGAERTRLSGHFELDLPKTENATKQRQEQKKTFLTRLKNDVQKPRFWLEVAAIIVVGTYTFEAWRANQLTQTALRLSEGADLVLDPIAFDQTTGVIALPFQNTGKRTAITTHEHFEEVRVQRPSETIFQHDRVDLYGSREIAPGKDFGPASYTIPNWKPSEWADIQKGTLTIVIGGIVTYDDGLGPKLGTVKSYRFCIQTFFHTTAKEMGWIHCGPTTLDQLLLRPATSHQEINKEK